MSRLTPLLQLPSVTLSLPVAWGDAQPPRLDHHTLAGRLTELSGVGAAAVLTLAFPVVREIQQRGEPVAWITSGESLFYPPDVSDSGVDCEAWFVICDPHVVCIARSDELLARYQSLGLFVLLL